MVKGRGLLRNERVFENALSETQKWVLGSITSVVEPGPYPYFLTTVVIILFAYIVTNATYYYIIKKF